ncbi:Metallo-dependent hydrolase [Violaceomyces palustris]|uniref:Metallo-dependent hydrolase n=1 Tax=Violaceomyces palustris TaxID=1673888 RepID=A0ACD0P746_9BASI|nr:Metallo-dependent hydrolase [Violaceomyces palustris]
MTNDQASNSRLIIKGGLVLQTDPESTYQQPSFSVKPLDLLVENGVITRVEPDIREESLQGDGPVQVFDARRKLITPGLIDTHRHLWQTVFRTYTADMTLFEFLNIVNVFLAAYMEPEDLYISQICGAVECINTGVTTVVDHFHANNSPLHSRAAIRALDSTGLRTRFCAGTNKCLDIEALRTRRPGPPFKDNSWQAKEILSIQAERGELNDPLVTLGVSLDSWKMGPPSATVDLVKRCREAGIEVFTMHLAEGALGPSDEPVRKLDSFSPSLLGKDMILSHANFLSEEELRIVREKQVRLSATPECEALLNMDLAITRKAQANDICCGLGVDTCALTEGSMFTAMRMAFATLRYEVNHEFIVSGKFPSQCPKTARFGAILRDATLGGARAASLEDKVGEVAVGKRADLVLLNLDTPNMIGIPESGIPSALVTHATTADIDSVFIDGVLRKQAGKVLGHDLEHLGKLLRESLDRILKRAEKDGEVGTQVSKMMAKVFSLDQIFAEEA